jgi:hypothetical protein
MFTFSATGHRLDVALRVRVRPVRCDSHQSTQLSSWKLGFLSQWVANSGAGFEWLASAVIECATPVVPTDNETNPFFLQWARPLLSSVQLYYYHTKFSALRRHCPLSVLGSSFHYPRSFAGGAGRPLFDDHLEFRLFSYIDNEWSGNKRAPCVLYTVALSTMGLLVAIPVRAKRSIPRPLATLQVSLDFRGCD